MHTNYEPNIPTTKYFSEEEEVETETVEASVNPEDLVPSLDELDAYESTKGKRLLNLTRTQRRKIVRDAEVRFNKQKRSFGKFAETLDLEELDFFRYSFRDFSNYPFPKKDMDLVMRGLSPTNFQTQDWSGWQREILDKYYQRALTKMLNQQQEVEDSVE